MKTLVIQAEDAIIDRIIPLFELFSQRQYDMKVLPYTDEDRELDELADQIDFDDEEQLMEFCVKMSDLGKRQWWATHYGPERTQRA
ncbi:hypothetical protein GF339_07435 [candidate division KSB3 bacterium]|uniref:Uncharacterized protein n=1 Tax=candidate division KSB3 bacterium TaxID=2044937 RepID=A0A9D5Q5M5_9BACT|nr:hypothetical protein [candidate division KSB3 bacterium]MBD3324402.1 hypothetical protein [candidate division KSB3 bacterium]